MKVVKYNPKEIENAPKFFNEEIEKCDDRFIMFIFDDIYDAANDIEEVKKAYQKLLEDEKLPYAFFPYYLHFNKVLPKLHPLQAPRLRFLKKDGTIFDVVGQPCFGLLALDLEKLKSIEFKFNETYKFSFYIQDLICRCEEKGLYYSTQFFLDVHDSFRMFKSEFNQGHIFAAKEFMEEKQRFFNENKINPQQINDFVTLIKSKYETPTIADQAAPEKPTEVVINE